MDILGSMDSFRELVSTPDWYDSNNNNDDTSNNDQNDEDDEDAR